MTLKWKIMSHSPNRNNRYARAACLLASVLCAFAGFAQSAEYVSIPSGEFLSVLPPTDKPIAVEIASFQLRSTPVTHAEFLTFIQNNPTWRRDRVAEVFAEKRYLQDWPSPDSINAQQKAQAITNVSWFAAQAFCESERARLPTWHEWEYVAAADATRRDARDDPAWRERILGWYAQTSGKTQGNVGGEPNVYGAKDMHGLIWEWVDDFSALMVSADNREQGDPDRQKFCGAGAMSMQDRENYAVLMRIALLSSLKAVDVTANLGFRCARVGDKGKIP